MTLMSCKRAEKLMPLYAAGDLPAGRESRAVAAHVSACASCAALAEEFRASRAWMIAADAVPEFGEEFYEQMRAGVLERINRDTLPAAPSRLASLFPTLFAGRRLAYAASLALAAFALALALYFFRDGVGPRRNDIAVAPPPSDSILPPRPAHVEPMPDAEQRPSPSASPDERRTAQPKLKRAGGAFKRTPTLRRTAPARDAAPARLLTATNNAARQAVAPNAGTAGLARIEIQTADPNIRIIWLAPSSGDEIKPDEVDPDR